MSGPRELATTLPSPSELDEFDLCQFSWLMKYRQGYEKVEPEIGRVVGKVLDRSLNAYYNGSSPNPAQWFVWEMAKERILSSLPDEEWAPWVAQGKELLEVYVQTFPQMAVDWENIIAVQPRYEWPCPCRPDLVVRKKETGFIAIVERKMESAWADLEYEKMKYEMSWQPIVYGLAVQHVLNEPVREIIMEFNQRGVPASGRYKAIPPHVERHSIPVEKWKSNMWLSSATLANQEMVEIESFSETRGALICDFPRRTRNCVQKLGKKTFPCWLFSACSVNTHPCDMPTLYQIPDWKKEGEK